MDPAEKELTEESWQRYVEEDPKTHIARAYGKYGPWAFEQLNIRSKFSEKDMRLVDDMMRNVCDIRYRPAWLFFRNGNVKSSWTFGALAPGWRAPGLRCQTIHRFVLLLEMNWLVGELKQKDVRGQGTATCRWCSFLIRTIAGQENVNGPDLVLHVERMHPAEIAKARQERREKMQSIREQLQAYEEQYVAGYGDEGEPIYPYPDLNAVPGPRRFLW